MLELVTVGNVIAIGHVSEMFERRAIAAGCIVLCARQLFAKRHDFTERGKKRAENIPACRQLVRLTVIAEGNLPTNDDLSRIGFDLFCNETKERRLPCTVGSHERRPLTEREA